MEEELKIPTDIPEAITEGKAFIDSLPKDSQDFLKFFMGEQRVCFRCILMLFNVPSLALYRI